MNREQRRGAARVAGSRTDKMARNRVITKDDACKVCAYIASTIIGARQQDFKDPDGNLVELHINQKLDPPLGVRFPQAAAKRQTCLDCAGIGRVGCPTCHGSGLGDRLTAETQEPCATCQGNGKLDCGKCMGSGINWIKEDFAPTCSLCGQFLMAWLQEREQLHRQKQGQTAASRIILPNARPRVGTGKILLG